MKTIDVIILTNTANGWYHNLLSECIRSIKSNTNINTNIIVVESNLKLVHKTIEDYEMPINVLLSPNEPFNFNRFLNYGIKASTSEYICLSNNDVIYDPNCFGELVKGLDSYDSVSPWEPTMSWNFHSKQENHEGYITRSHITGWCICIKRSTIEKIGLLDENFSFWYADDDYAKTLETNGLKHALIGKAEAVHLIEKSHGLIPYDKREEKTINQGKVYDKKWKK